MSVLLLRSAVPGLLLGFVVGRLGFTDYGELHRMLVFIDLRLFSAFVLAVNLLVLAFMTAGKGWVLPRGTFHRGLVPGAILFGIGWALTGACPGVALVQVGQGSLPALASLAGIGVGIGLQQWGRSK